MQILAASGIIISMITTREIRPRLYEGGLDHLFTKLIVNSYKEEHQNILNDAATTLQISLPQDTLMNNVLPFLDLPSYTFEDHDESEEEEEDDSEEEEMEVNL